jgi:hypothetical protein
VWAIGERLLPRAGLEAFAEVDALDFGVGTEGPGVAGAEDSPVLRDADAAGDRREGTTHCIKAPSPYNTHNVSAIYEYNDFALGLFVSRTAH